MIKEKDRLEAIIKTWKRLLPYEPTVSQSQNYHAEDNHNALEALKAFYRIMEEVS